MPSLTSNCSFRAASDGGVEFRIEHRRRAVTGWMKARSSVPVYEACSISVISAYRGKAPQLVLGTSFRGAYLEGADSRLDFVRRTAYLADIRFPALFEYDHGRSVFCVEVPSGELVLSRGCSPASAVGVPAEVADVLPAGIGNAFSTAAARFRTLLSNGLFGGCPTDAAKGALSRIEQGGRLVESRGDIGEYFVWSFDGSDADGETTKYEIAGVSARQVTLTLLFPFLPEGAEYDAVWHDDREDYYVKGDLEVRPSVVTRSTKAVVKTAAENGGFTLDLCLRR